MTEIKRNAWSRARTCCDCGKVESVRKDNKSERCVSCAASLRTKCPAAIAGRAERSTAVTVTCTCCKKEFKRSRSQANGTKEPYCSLTCAHSHKKIDRECKYCKSAFRVHKSIVSGPSNSTGNFCSRPCYDKWLCRTGRVTGRGSQWKKIREAVKAKSPFCGWCGTVRGQLQVHHIAPFRLTHDNTHKNLIPLCVRCHKHIEVITVEVEAMVATPDELFTVMNTLLRPRQLATLAILRRIAK